MEVTKNYQKDQKCQQQKILWPKMRSEYFPTFQCTKRVKLNLLILYLLSSKSQSVITKKLPPHFYLHYIFLFMPSYRVLNFLMKYSSRSFLYSVFRYLTRSNIVIFRSLKVWPGEVKWAPVACDVISLLTYPLCSARRCFKIRLVSPMYLFSLQYGFWHSINLSCLLHLNYHMKFFINFPHLNLFTLICLVFSN